MQEHPCKAVERVRRLALLVTLPGLVVGAIATSGASASEYVQVTTLAPEDLRGTDFFGEHLALSGDWLAVASDDWNAARGKVYIFERREGGSNAWGLTAEVQDPTPLSGEYFGYSVDLDGTTLAVGRLSDVTDSIYVFERTSWGGWEFSAEIGDRFYGQNAISGNTIIGGDAAEQRVYVYERNAGGPGHWGLVAGLRPSDDTPGGFAQSLAIDGDVVVAGKFLDDELARDAGSAYVWERDEAGNWQELEVAKLLASDGAEGDEFGNSVAVEGDLIAIGAGSADAPLTNTGAVYLYRRDAGGGWSEVAKLVATDAQRGDVMGRSSVAISRGRVIAGATHRDVGEIEDAGAAIIFEQTASGAWHQTATLRSSDEEENDTFGSWVSASGDTVAVSAPLDPYPISSGSAYVFQRVAAPVVEVAGSCPGTMSFRVSGATPGGAVAIGGAPNEGLTDSPGAVCPEVQFGLAEPRLLRRLVVDADGRAEFSGPLGPETCGWYLQAVDLVTCGVGGISQLP